jgi:transposase
VPALFQQYECPICHNVKAEHYFHGNQCRDCYNKQHPPHPSQIPSPPSPSLSSSLSPSIFGRPDQCIDQLSFIERAAIITLHQVGWTGRDIAKELHCSENTVSLWLNHWRETNSLSDSNRSGRPQLLDEPTSNSIIEYSHEHHTAEPKDIKRELQLDVSPRTIRRELNAAGLISHIQQTEYDFSEFDLQRRLAFANEYIQHNGAWWSRVFFSDETHFYLGHYGRVHVQCPIGASHQPEYVRKEKQLKGKVSLWGCISAEGLGHAELYVGSLDSVKYRDILRHSLIRTFREIFPRGPWYFQQDNARFHTTPETISFLHEKGVTFIEWPPWSPDLNPIENLWNDLKRRVYNRFPQTMEQLEEFIRQEWQATDLNFISRICRSMPDRLQLLLDNEGHKIHY